MTNNLRERLIAMLQKDHDTITACEKADVILAQARDLKLGETKVWHMPSISFAITNKGLSGDAE